MKYFIVDAFADSLFKGNQAGVCLLDEWLDTATMQKIAFENNLAETAFVVKREKHYDLKWFTPEIEIDLCGHATLASAFIVFSFIDTAADVIEFNTLSGILKVSRSEDMYEMDFPARSPKKIELTPQMSESVGVPVLEAYISRDLLMLVEDEEKVLDLVPDYEIMKALPDSLGKIVTARGTNADFVSRFFMPGSSIPEDPVTGSAHSTLIPFWAERLGKDEMIAKQLSERGGTLYCKNEGDRVKIAGKAVLYLQGEILIPVDQGRGRSQVL